MRLSGKHRMTIDKTTEENIDRRNIRVKFIGTWLHYLFGVRDYDCTTKANRAIEKTDKNEKTFYMSFNNKLL